MAEKIFVIVIAALMFLAVLAITGIVGLLVAFIVVWLWNMCLPQLFGLPIITYWQAWALYLLIAMLISMFKQNSESK